MIVLKRILRSNLYPSLLQWPTAIVFALVVFQLLYGPTEPSKNFGTAVLWVLWWPIIPLVFVLLGRFWCAICPFATLNDLVQKWLGNTWKVPQFLKKYGIWIIDAAFILITWGDHVFGFVESPRGSGLLLLLIVTGVVASAAFFERRTWCRYLCFLGGLSGNYSRVGAVGLRTTPSICKLCNTKECYRGNGRIPGCPMFEFPRSMDTSARCNLCGYCIKACPHDSVRVNLRVPSRELWFIRRPRLEESFLAIVIMGIVFVQNITMLEVWERAQAWVARLLGVTSYAATFTFTFSLAMFIPVLLLLGAGKWAGKYNRESAVSNFTRFGYALIPLDLAGHLAHNLFHLLAEGKAVWFTFLALFGWHFPDASLELASGTTVKALQFVLIGLGTITSVYTAYRIAQTHFTDMPKQRSFLPVVILVLALALFNVYLFVQPMAHRV